MTVLSKSMTMVAVAFSTISFAQICSAQPTVEDLTLVVNDTASNANNKWVAARGVNNPIVNENGDDTGIIAVVVRISQPNSNARVVRARMWVYCAVDDPSAPTKYYQPYELTSASVADQLQGTVLPDKSQGRNRRQEVTLTNAKLGLTVYVTGFKLRTNGTGSLIGRYKGLPTCQELKMGQWPRKSPGGPPPAPSNCDTPPTEDVLVEEDTAPDPDDPAMSDDPLYVP